MRDVRDVSAVQLEHERLEVYAVCLELHAGVCEILPGRGVRIVRDQLERASLSIVTNVAEGAGKRSGPDKRRFYEIARGSATETAALLDVMRGRRLAPSAALFNVRILLVRTIQMLSRLCGPPREPTASSQEPTLEPP